MVYLKRLTTGPVEVEVTLFVLRVRREMDRWREKKARTRRRLTVQEAARRVQEPELQAHIKKAMKLFAAHPKHCRDKARQSLNFALLSPCQIGVFLRFDLSRPLTMGYPVVDRRAPPQFWLPAASAMS